MIEQAGAAIAFVFATYVLAASLGVLMGWFVTRNAWRDEMIKRGHARFHWENAKWYWVEDLPPPPPDPAAKKVRMLREEGF